MSGLRVAIVGGRRTRQGLGPFVARDLTRAGANVVAFTATTDESREVARDQIGRFAGIAPRGYLSLDALLDAESLDAIAVCSPHEAHSAGLERALAGGLHALCDKPLIWGDAFAGRTASMVDRFATSGRILFENAQWPYTVATFDALHPGARNDPPRSFRMFQQPATRGAAMLADSLPHPLSLLQQIAPDPAPRLDDLTMHAPSADRREIGFGYLTAATRIEVELRLERSDAHPRRTRYEIDGFSADREVDPGDYTLRLRDGDRSVPLEDPMAELIADFVRCASAGADPRAHERGVEIKNRAALLEQLVAAEHARERSGA